MTQKKNDNPTGTNPPTQGNVKGPMGQGKGVNQPKDQSGSNVSGTNQMGGKISPAGGPEPFGSDQVNQGKPAQEPTTQGGSRIGRGDPYPPANPDRPVMASGSEVGNVGGIPAESAESKIGGTTSGLEEEEE